MSSESAENLRYNLVFSLLAGRNTTIHAPEPFDRFELQFVELLTVLTRGSKAIFSQGNRRLDFSPGSIGPRDDLVRFDCGTQRSIAYFAEAVLLLLAFGPAPVAIEFTGITNDTVDVDLDRLIDGLLPILARCLQGSCVLGLKVAKRGFRPSGGGLATLSVQPVPKLLAGFALAASPVRRVRGLAIAARVSPQFIGRMIAAVRDVLNDFLPDVWVYSEAVRGVPDRFLGVSLVTDSGVSAQAGFDALTEGAMPSPEELGDEAARALLDEIVFGGGAVDSSFQSIVFGFMGVASGPSAVVVGRVTDHAAATLRLLKRFFGVQFEFVSEVDEESPAKLVNAKCRGAGLRNRFREAS